MWAWLSHSRAASAARSFWKKIKLVNGLNLISWRGLLAYLFIYLFICLFVSTQQIDLKGV